MKFRVFAMSQHFGNQAKRRYHCKKSIINQYSGNMFRAWNVENSNQFYEFFSYRFSVISNKADFDFWDDKRQKHLDDR